MAYRRAVAILFALLVIPILSSAAPSPRAEIEAFFERAKSILSEASDVAQARAEFRNLTHALFDGRAAARRAFGSQWDAFTVTERSESARVFSVVFERAYLEIVQGQLPRHRIPSVRVLGEDMAGDRQAIVRTSVTARDGSDVQMDYAMGRIGERWKVHDVVINGVSLVENYHAQFARVLQTSGSAALMERLRAAASAGPPSLAAMDADAPAEVVVYFGANRADLAEGGRRELDRVAPMLAANGRARVLVEGHADRRGDSRSNDTLAERRARAIREHLVGSGVDADRIKIVAHGARRPLCGEPTESCWARNRRASVRLTP